MKNGKNFSAIFFLALFFLFNVVSLHALTEHDDDTSLEHCEICHSVAAASFIPLVETEPSVIPGGDFFFTDQQINDKARAVTCNSQYLSSHLFTRPPPPFFS